MKTLFALILVAASATASQAQTRSDVQDAYAWLEVAPRVDCVSLPSVEREKFGCILDRPPETNFGVAGLDWPWLTAVRPVDCVVVPPPEREKFASCDMRRRPDERDLERDARRLVDGLRQTRDLFQARYERAQRRRRLLTERASVLATPEQIDDLEAAKSQLGRLETERSRADLVDAFTAAVETMALPRAELSARPPLSFAVIRARADAFATAAPDSPSLARLDRGERVLKIGDDVVNARRLIFAPSTNFVFVGASLVIDEVAEKSE